MISLKHSPIHLARRATIAVALCLAMMTGCHTTHHRKLDQFVNPKSCPSCMAIDVDSCSCFPHDVASGYHETNWSCLEEPISTECSVQQVYELGDGFLDIEQIPLPKE